MSRKDSTWLLCTGLHLTQSDLIKGKSLPNPQQILKLLGGGSSSLSLKWPKNINWAYMPKFVKEAFNELRRKLVY